MLKVEIINSASQILFSEKGESIDCIYSGAYSEGDKLVIHKKDAPFLKLKLDEALSESIVYSESSKIEFEIPFGALMRGYDKNAFSGAVHRIRISEAEDDEVYKVRNLALNPYDKRGQKNYFPHARANLVTREDVAFYERNAIDGVCKNDGHGDWPYHSWAGGAREDLEYFIDLGREAEIEELVFSFAPIFRMIPIGKRLTLSFRTGRALGQISAKPKKGNE